NEVRFLVLNGDPLEARVHQDAANRLLMSAQPTGWTPEAVKIIERDLAVLPADEPLPNGIGAVVSDDPANDSRLFADRPVLQLHPP
ncbi:MAG: hypothetical protein GTO46_00010, partial [Gemmatimonadetes bacterium]|nr:hypothetical protein [Gemmatimonadota bacterium]